MRLATNSNFQIQICFSSHKERKYKSTIYERVMADPPECGYTLTATRWYLHRTCHIRNYMVFKKLIDHGKNVIINITIVVH